MKDLPSVEVLETILQRSIETHDWEGVDASLKLIAVQDPHRAQTLMETMKVGIAISRERRS
jgi:hypothetical protein